MLVDEVEIRLKSGRGGDGITSFRREKYIPKGGPDGGDGGDGGNIIFKIDPNTDTLSYFNTHKQFAAENGQHGMSKKKHGRNGRNLTLKIPPGTIIYEIKNNKIKKLADLVNTNKEFLICRGGQGGLGNTHFKSATHQTPHEFTKGEKGQRERIKLELQMIADVGLIGLPNSGKSTLISAISSARPKVADYPFTTLIPNLGLVEYNKFKFIVADIPGIIKGASRGKGLGIEFLKHIKRTKLNIIILDSTGNLKNDFRTILSEIDKYDKKLSKKVKIIVFNKIDLINPQTIKSIKSKFKRILNKHEIVFISALKRINIDKFLKIICENLKKLSN